MFCFGVAEEREVFLSSADWMERNFFLRIEACFPLRDPDLAKRVYQEAISNYLDDNVLSWELSSDGRYRKSKKSGKHHSAQKRLLVELSEHP